MKRLPVPAGLSHVMVLRVNLIPLANSSLKMSTVLVPMGKTRELRREEEISLKTP
jgi:hypothetical protein